MTTSKYPMVKKYILKYQKENPNYKIYRRKYEKTYRQENRIMVNYNSWKSMRKKSGKEPTMLDELNYLVARHLGEPSWNHLIKNK